MAGNNRIGTVYLLHFSRPFGHARHYLGWAKRLKDRLSHHDNGSGANLLRHVREAGITWVVARTWEKVDRNEERRLKKRGGASRLCPICQALAKERLDEAPGGVAESASPVLVETRDLLDLGPDDCLGPGDIVCGEDTL